MIEYDVVTRTLKKKRYMKIRAAAEGVVDAAEKESFFEEEPHNMLVDEEPEVPTTSEEVPKSFRMKRNLQEHCYATFQNARMRRKLCFQV